MPDGSYIPGWGNVTSSVNSTSTASSPFTGTFENLPYPWVFIGVLSDVAGTLTVEFSHDGGTTTHSTLTFTIAANTYLFRPLLKTNRSVKVTVTVAGVASLSVQTDYGFYDAGIFAINGSISADAGGQLVVPVDHALYVSAGRFGGQYPVNKFGQAPNGMQATLTDIWDRADATPTQQIWLAPTAARIHTLVSSDTNDDGSPAGTGAQTVRVWYLADWSTRETFEDVIMDGTSGVAMSNAAVMINRMRVIAFGSSGPNIGTITATAATDATITAAILPGVGSTAMAIFGWPSTQTFYVKNWKNSINKASGAPAHATFQLRYNPVPDTVTTGFDEVDLTGRESDGGSSGQEIYDPYLPLAGPGILKVSAIASSADIDGSSGFGGILVDN